MDVAGGLSALKPDGQTIGVGWSTILAGTVHLLLCLDISWLLALLC